MRPITDEERAAVRRVSGITARRIAYRLRAVIPNDDPTTIKLWNTLASDGFVRRVPAKTISFFCFFPELLRAALDPADKMTSDVRRVFEAPDGHR
jgi:hypothetical protein